MEVNNVFLMRRRHDSWLNATQILKVAGIDKGKRTKVLEKEILAGEHEKVQGGYGKYQGTWVNYRRGREFCRQYGVEELLRPLLEYDMGQDGVSQAGQGSIDTPTKEQAMAAQRKKMMYNGGIENRHPTQSPNATFFKSISATAANAVNAMNKTRIDSPGPRPASGNKRPQPAARRPSMQTASQESLFPGSSQQSIQSVHSDMTATATNGHLDPAFGSQSGPYFANPNQAHDSSFNEPPRKRVRRSSIDPFSQETSGGYDHSQEESTLVEDTSSFYHQAGQTNRNIDQAIIGVQPLPQPTSKRDLEKQQLLVALFLDHAQAEFRDHPTLNALSGEELDIPMDGTAHTALHWAATLGRTSLIRALIARGASIYRVNGGGETALIRAALTTNNLDQGTFPELLELLGPTIEMRDGRGRTVLHHIAMSSAVKGRSAACKYYLESLLEFVVRQGSASNSQHPSFNDVNDSSYPKPKCIGLARFMSEIVNAQDMSGDTALNLAARIGNKSIIQQLLEVGANPTIPNYGGLKPVDFGVGGDPDPNDSQANSQTTREQTAISKVGDASRELTSCKYFL
jgi:regulatory protein SWI6